MFISIVFIPQCLMALSLVGTPLLCEGIPSRELYAVDSISYLGEIFAHISGGFFFLLNYQTLLDRSLPFQYWLGVFCIQNTSTEVGVIYSIPNMR